MLLSREKKMYMPRYNCEARSIDQSKSKPFSITSLPHHHHHHHNWHEHFLCPQVGYQNCADFGCCCCVQLIKNKQIFKVHDMQFRHSLSLLFFLFIYLFFYFCFWEIHPHFKQLGQHCFASHFFCYKTSGRSAKKVAENGQKTVD